jgi:aryl carrier-like protein
MLLKVEMLESIGMILGLAVNCKYMFLFVRFAGITPTSSIWLSFNILLKQFCVTFSNSSNDVPIISLIDFGNSCLNHFFGRKVSTANSHVANVIALWRGEKLPPNFLHHQINRPASNIITNETRNNLTADFPTDLRHSSLPVSKTGMLSTVQTALASVLSSQYIVADIADMPFKDIGIDSFGMLTLASKLNEQNLSMNIGDLYKYPTLSQLVSFLERSNQNYLEPRRNSAKSENKTSLISELNRPPSMISTSSTSTRPMNDMVVDSDRQPRSLQFPFSSSEDDISTLCNALSAIDTPKSSNLLLGQRRFLITGATGYLGRHILFDLLTKGVNGFIRLIYIYFFAFL